MAEIKHTTVDKLIPDDKNFNKGTEFGKGLLDKSFSKFGAGRSILIDKNNRIIAGNKATESFGESGGEKVIVVETTGDTLVAVKRTDIDLDSKEGRELALADNATQKADLAWDAGALDEVAGEWEIDPAEWGLKDEDWKGESPDSYGEAFELPEGEKTGFRQMTFQLADEQAQTIEEAITKAKGLEEFKYMINHGNENGNGNALALIVEQWLESRI